jgi:hypothetical protein
MESVAVGATVEATLVEDRFAELEVILQPVLEEQVLEEQEVEHQQVI